MDRSVALQVGPYRFHHRLGEGGSGQVWRATGPDGEVAVKILGPAIDLDDAARARFAREVAALGRLAHPHLIRLLDHGVDDELGPYLVVPVIDGATLRDAVRGAALGPDAAIALARPVAAAAAALHAAGYVHRDLKPENVMIDAAGEVTVIDLGLAWREGMTRHTETGTAVGSVGYMAPEQLEGHRVDASADVWALGVMLYEWTCGQRPFARARASEEAAAALVGAFPPLDRADRRVDPRLAAIVTRCLAADPAARPAAAELLAVLDELDVDAGGDAATQARGRAEALAASGAYAARVAATRVPALVAAARAALGDGRPFAALALCDRALAHAPDSTEVAAVVAEAEAATAGAPAAEAATGPVPEVAYAPTVVGHARRRDAAAPPTATAASTTPPRRPRWPWLAGAVAATAAAGVAVVWLTRAPAAPAPAPPPPPVEVTTETDPEGLDVARDFLSLIGDVMASDAKRKADVAAGRAPPVAPSQRPSTAAGWLALAERQPLAEALLSVRQALALQPTWRPALVKQCEVLTALEDPGARAACAQVPPAPTPP